MKNRNYIVVVAVIIGVVFSACKKENHKLVEIDCREFFVGTYKGIRTTTVSEYIAGTTNTAVTVDSNAVYTITKKGDFPSTEMNSQGTIYYLDLDDKTRTRAVNISGGQIIRSNYQIKTSSSFWSNSYTQRSTVFVGTKGQ